MVGLLLARRDAAQIHQRYSADGLDENQRPADAGGWLPLRGQERSCGRRRPVAGAGAMR
jgi:hypothetical protein